MTEVALVTVALAVLLLAGSRILVGPSDPVAVRLTFPRTVTAEQAVAAVRSLAGLLPPWWRRLLGTPVVTLEARADAGGIEHVLTVPRTRAEHVLGALRAAVPGLRVSEEASSLPAFGLVRELRPRGAGRLRTDAADASTTGILAALHPLRDVERALIQYVIAPTGRPPLAWLSEWFDSLRQAAPSERKPEPVEPVFAVAIRAAVAAGSKSRRAQLMARLLGPFHALNAPDRRLTRRLLPSEVVARRLRRGEQSAAALLDAEELASCLPVPLDAPELPGLTLAGSRELPPVSSVPRRGLVLGDSTVAGSTRPVAVGHAECRRGIHVCAPTGAGKSTILTNLAIQLMAAKARPALIAIDSKGDLIADIADRIPAARRGDVIVFDPADRGQPVGFNLIGGGGEADLVVDHVVSELRTRYGPAGLGPRSEDILRAALTTLTSQPNSYTLCEVEPLLGSAAFRQKLVGSLDNPVLQSFWSWYGSLSEAHRAEAIAPLSNKLRTYTLRRRVRAVIGQSGGLDLAEALAGDKIVLISLARGLIGADASALIGAAMTSRLWAAIQARAGVPASERRPATVICDEFQDFAAVSPVFADAVSQSRGYGVSWVLAHQHLAQLDTATRQAVLANCRTRLVMQTTAADAAAFAREFKPHLEAADLQGLGAYEGFAAISTGASVAPPASVRTRPAPDPLGTTAAVREASRQRYGTPPEDVDAVIRARITARTPAPVGGARRQP